MWQIVEAYRALGSVGELAAGGAASQRQIELALAYAQRYDEEVDRAIADNRRSLEQLHDEHPFIALSTAAE